MTAPDAPAASGTPSDSDGQAGPDAVVDARGLRCPLPVIRLARLVRDEPTVVRVTVLATDPAADHDIPAWCRMRGHDYLGARREEGFTAHDVGVVRPSEPAAAP